MGLWHTDYLNSKTYIINNNSIEESEFKLIDLYRYRGMNGDEKWIGSNYHYLYHNSQFYQNLDDLINNNPLNNVLIVDNYREIIDSEHLEENQLIFIPNESDYS